MKIYLVGGAVRDELLGLVPKDRDWVIVGARGDDIATMEADGYTQVGADFPVYLHPVSGDEYALARIERKVGHGYHGFEVDADSSVTIEDDLARRDLTINSMARDEDGTLVDPFNGKGDLRKHVLRHTSPAFAEDPLRVLRLARFGARFANFTVAPDTITLCQKLCEAGELNHLAVERIWVELEKGFNEPAPARFVSLLAELGAIEHCAVLRDIFGHPLTPTQLNIAAKLVSISDERLVVAIGALGANDSTMPGANNRVRDCHTNVQALFSTQKSAKDVYGLVKRARGLQDGPTFGDLVTAALVMEAAGYRGAFSPRKLFTAQRVMREVRAADFPGIEGKELGAAIETQRILNLQQAMSIPKENSAQQQG
jgi:hypothetical protein